MPQVQLQRLDADGVPVEVYDVDVAGHREWSYLMEPLDRRAREEGGSTLTTTPGARRYLRPIYPPEDL
jgi:hypothetical protein